MFVAFLQNLFGQEYLGTKIIRLAHATGRVVHVWTVNEEAEMHRLIELGVDGLVSDDLTTLKRVVIEHGLWEGGS